MTTMTTTKMTKKAATSRQPSFTTLETDFLMKVVEQYQDSITKRTDWALVTAQYGAHARDKPWTARTNAALKVKYGSMLTAWKREVKIISRASGIIGALGSRIGHGALEGEVMDDDVVDAGLLYAAVVTAPSPAPVKTKAAAAPPATGKAASAKTKTKAVAAATTSTTVKSGANLKAAAKKRVPARPTQPAARLKGAVASNLPEPLPLPKRSLNTHAPTVHKPVANRTALPNSSQHAQNLPNSSQHAQNLPSHCCNHHDDAVASTAAVTATASTTSASNASDQDDDDIDDTPYGSTQMDLPAIHHLDDVDMDAPSPKRPRTTTSTNSQSRGSSRPVSTAAASSSTTPVVTHHADNQSMTGIETHLNDIRRELQLFRQEMRDIMLEMTGYVSLMLTRRERRTRSRSASSIGGLPQTMAVSVTES